MARIVVAMTDLEDSRTAADQQFVQTMKRVRQERKWSQSDLAGALKSRGWSVARQAIVSRIEMGDREVRLGEAYLIAQVLGMSVEAMAAPDDVHLLLRELDSGAERVKRQAQAVREGLELLTRHADHLKADVGRAQAYLEDRSDSPHEESIRRAIDAAEDVLAETSGAEE